MCVRACVSLSVYSCCIHVTPSSRGRDDFSLLRNGFERTIPSRGRTFPRTRFRGRVSRRIVHEAFIRRDTCVTTVCGTSRAPGLGGILLSVRVSREDDNAHGIAVASFNAHLIARQDEVEASWYCARIRPETRDVDHSGWCAPSVLFFLLFLFFCS